MTNQDAYQALIKANVHWSRQDDNHIVVWTEGYLTQDCHNIEKFLLGAKMRIVKQEFDKYCGKTFTVYKHKGGVK